jgi:NRE family putative nickel resistance protein-like MFS transporter
MNDSQTKKIAAATLWGNRDFKLLFGAQIISLTGSGVTTVGLALFAYQLTGGASATAVIGNALTLRILAISLLVLALNAVGDALNRALDPKSQIDHFDKLA